MKYTIIAHDNWQVWAIMDDDRRIYCGVFKTKAQAQAHIKHLKGQS